MKMVLIHLFKKGLHPNVYVVWWDSIAKFERKKNQMETREFFFPICTSMLPSLCSSEN